MRIAYKLKMQVSCRICGNRKDLKYKSASRANAWRILNKIHESDHGTNSRMIHILGIMMVRIKAS